MKYHAQLIDMKKLITILLFLPLIGVGQTWTQQMIDSSKAQFCGTDTTLYGRLDTYVDSVFNFNGGEWYLIGGDTTLTYAVMLTRFADTLKAHDYVLRPPRLRIISE